MTQSIKNSCSSGKAVFKLQESRKGWQWSQRSDARAEKVLQKAVHCKASNSAHFPPTGCRAGGQEKLWAPQGAPGAVGEAGGELYQSKQILQGSKVPTNPWEVEKYLKGCKLLQIVM